MSPFVSRSRLPALALLAAAALTGPSSAPALADARPVQAAVDPCPHLTVRTVAGCRVVRRHGTVEARRLPSYAEARDVFTGGRYVSLLILGVGF